MDGWTIIVYIFSLLISKQCNVVDYNVGSHFSNFKMSFSGNACQFPKNNFFYYMYKKYLKT